MLIELKGVLTPDDIKATHKALEAASFQDGTVSGKKALKKNLQINANAPEIQQLTPQLKAALMRRPDFTSFALPRNITMMFNRYDAGMEYKAHIDAALMGPSAAEMIRSDVSFTLFLSGPDSYEGGELVMDHGYGESAYKPEAGSAVVYPSSMFHRVNPVKSGTRLAAVGWVQSVVQSEERRQITYELFRLRTDVTRALPDSDLPERVGLVYQNLLRLWAQV